MTTRLVTQEVTKSPTRLAAGLPIPLLLMPLQSDLRLLRGVGSATFTRSTIKRYLHKDTGLITVAAIDEAAFEQDGILIEGASTWEALHNRDFTNAVHVKTNITAVKDATGADGVANAASTLTATAANGTAFQTITKASAENTFSLDVRRKTGTGTIEITDDGGSTFTDITTSINSVSYTRFQITTTQANPSIGLRIVTSGDEIEVDYEGLEALSFASSRIEVTTTPLTRTADNLSIPIANFNETTGTVSLTASLIGIDSSANQFFYSIDNGATSKRHILIKASTSNNTRTLLVDTSTQADYTAPPTWTADTIRKIAYTYATNDVETFIDSLSIGSDSVATVPTGLTTINIGKDHVGGSQLFGHIKDFRTDIVVLTDAQQGALP